MNPNYSEFRFPQIRKQELSKLFRSKTPPEAIGLITKLLVYNPEQRYKPLEALCHQFFDELRDEKTRLPSGNKLPDLFDGLREEINSIDSTLADKLIPKWYKAER
jgi:serine/threonine protein kinase